MRRSTRRRLHGVVDRRGHVLRHAQPADDPADASSIRCSGSSAPATSSGPPPIRWPAASSSAPPPAAPPVELAETRSTPDGHSQPAGCYEPRRGGGRPRSAYDIGHRGRAGWPQWTAQTQKAWTSTSPSTTSGQVQPGQLEGLDVDSLLRGIYRYRQAPQVAKANTAQILVSGVAMPEALCVAGLWPTNGDAAADVWSVTSRTS